MEYCSNVMAAKVKRPGTGWRNRTSRRNDDRNLLTYIYDHINTNAQNMTYFVPLWTCSPVLLIGAKCFPIRHFYQAMQLKE